ncbi:MAG: hypothetical protein IT460_17250 [Planctomycetes bacterium]|nr:hypothetical protein [Planctomycetota bacterium]
MRSLRWVAAALAATLAACSDDKGGATSKPPPTSPADAHADEHKAPHGGELLELGEHEAHLEIVHDHKGGNMTVYVLDGELKSPISVAPPTVTIRTKDGNQEFTLTAVNPKPDGTADTWKGSHPGLVADPWDGRIRLTVRGKAFQSPLEGESHEGHGH